jgi:aminoglycoside/choline kinase family phosphotransferase
MTRADAIRAFLADTGFAAARIEPLAQDASFRRYWRLHGAAGSVVLMDAPPPEDIRPFLRMAGHLRGIGLSAPAILKADADAGFVLEEDLGDALLADRLDAGHDVTAPLRAAADALIILQRAEPPAGLPAWTAPPMTDTALGTLFDWWWPARFGGPAPSAARAEVAAALAATLAPLDDGPHCLVHRDFFAGNLLLLPARPGPSGIGIIDFQGAAIGHPAYDLASLLQDARRDIAPDLAAAVLDHYLARRPELDPAAFRHAYAACAAQRHLRVACQWVRLALRDHRPAYLAHGPRTWALLNRALAEPSVARLRDALDRWVPAEQRGNPPGLAA